MSNVSIVSVATLIGTPQLGAFFTQGLQLHFLTPIIAGSALCVVLAIALDGLVLGGPPKSLFPAQNIVPVIATPKISDAVTQTLDAVSAALTTDDLVVMNGRLAKHESFDSVAGDWLAQHKLN